MSVRESNAVRVSGDRCPYCHDQVEPSGEKTGCETCMAWHHAPCWEAHGGCSGCGFVRPESARAVRPTRADPKRPGTICFQKGCSFAPLATERYCLEHAIRHRRQVAGVAVCVGVLLAPMMGLLLFAAYASQTKLLTAGGWALLMFMFSLTLMTFVRARRLLREAKRLEQLRDEDRP